MNRNREGLKINLQIVRNGRSKLQSTPQPQTAGLIRRRNLKTAGKINKTPEQMIDESYYQLMGFIDSLDNRVQQIVKTYEIQFLQAYNNHIKKVKYDMQELKQSSLNNLNSQKALQEKIDSMEKQLRIFRQQSLILFDKVTAKDKQLTKAYTKIKQVQKQNKEFQKTIYQLTKSNKQLQIILQNIKTHQTSIIRSIPKHQEDSHKIDYHKEQSFTMVNRPFSTAYRTKSYYDQHKKNNKPAVQEDGSRYNTKIDKTSSGTKMRNPFVLNQAGTVPQNSENNKTARQMRSQNYQHRRRNSLKMDHSINLKSYQFSERQKYLKIFKNCVQEIKSQINKKSKNTSLNFFKENGPKNFVQFKKQDFYTLLQLLLTNQSILMQFYKMIFNRQAQF